MEFFKLPVVKDDLKFGNLMPGINLKIKTLSTRTRRELN